MDYQDRQLRCLWDPESPEVVRMNLTEARRLEAIRYLGEHYVLHPEYNAADHPWHSSYARVDVRLTFLRVRCRMRELAKQALGQSLSAAVEDHKQRLRLAHSRRVARAA